MRRAEVMLPLSHMQWATLCSCSAWKPPWYSSAMATDVHASSCNIAASVKARLCLCSQRGQAANASCELQIPPTVGLRPGEKKEAIGGGPLC